VVYPDHDALRYDNLHQLTGSTIVIGNTTYHETFEYNAAGNRASRTLGATTDTYTYTSGTNKLASISGGKTVSFTYDDLGRMTLYSEEDGDTLVKAQSYFYPQGLMYGKEDWTEHGETVVVGNTVAQFFTPAAERVLKFNASTEETRLFAYDLSGNLIYEGGSFASGAQSDEPVIEHIWLGNHLIATVTGSGDACFIVTAAYGTALAKDLIVFKAFRDRWLERFEAGKGFVNWYYHGGGPSAASWLQAHDTARLGTRLLLSVMAVPLKVFLFGKIIFLLLIFLCALCAFACAKKLGLKWSSSSLAGLALAIGLVIGYSYLMDVPPASASYTQGGIYYYTSDHIGRPFTLRDANKDVTWYEQHMAFGDPINEWSSSMPAGSGDYLISWKPSFRFPGQFQDPDMDLAYTSSPFFVQNHYREYMPGLGRYNRIDPLTVFIIRSKSLPQKIHFDQNLLTRHLLPFSYSHNNSLTQFDQQGLRICKLTQIYCFDERCPTLTARCWEVLDCVLCGGWAYDPCLCSTYYWFDRCFMQSEVPFPIT